MTKDIRRQHGALCWGELVTEDPKAAGKFYGEVFGWTAKDVEMEDGAGTYTCFTNREGVEVTGAMKPIEEGIPNHWGLFMHVDDVDAVVEATVKLGGKVVMPAFDAPDVGRMAYLSDPQGAGFAVIKLSSPE